MLKAMRVARFLPITLIRVLAWTGAQVVWMRRGRSTHRLEDNLRRATGLQGWALRRLSRRSITSTARYYAEVLELGRISGVAVDHRVRNVGLHRAYAEIERTGRVAVVLSHSGNWDLVGAWACRNVGLVKTVAEVLKPREVFDEFVALREKLGFTVLGHEGATTFREMVRIGLSEGGVLALVADRDLSGDGVVTEMFGHEVRVAPGPAALALATDTVLFPLYAHYERIYGRRRWKARSRWGTVMEWGPPVRVPADGKKSEKVQSMTDQWAYFMSRRIQEHPEDWHMMQRFGWVE